MKKNKTTKNTSNNSHMLLFCVWKLHFVEDYILQYEQEERHLCPAMIKLR